MLDRIEEKIEEIVEAILAKPTAEFTKDDFDILVIEYGRRKMAIDSAEHSKKMAEMIAGIWEK